MSLAVLSKCSVCLYILYMIFFVFGSIPTKNLEIKNSGQRSNNDWMAW